MLYALCLSLQISYTIGVNMRLLIQQYDTKRIMKDRSLTGLPRWVIEEMIEGKWTTTKVYSKLWYSLKKVQQIEDLI